MPKQFSSVLIFIAALLIVSAAQISVRAQPAGGRITNEPKPSTRTPAKTNPTPKSPPRETPRTEPRPTSGVLDRIDGKWWTTGNSFGDSEVIFTQDGSRVSGVINWADGRTGSVNGTLTGKRLQFTWTDSRGDGGSGWLELSWANFLGGPWHNQRV